MKTIGRNRKKFAAEIFDKAVSCSTLSLDNCFQATECPIDYARSDWEKFYFAKLQSLGDGNFRVYVHSNRWYTIVSRA